jgi:hypothetical protein
MDRDCGGAVSHVDNVILSFSILEDAAAIMPQVDGWLGDRCGQRFGRDFGDSEDEYGGGKYLETPFYVAAFNYIPESDFIAFLRTLPWCCSADVQYIVKRQHSERFEIVTLADTVAD